MKKLLCITAYIFCIALYGKTMLSSVDKIVNRMPLNGLESLLTVLTASAWLLAVIWGFIHLTKTENGEGVER